jgi:DNA-binding FadR family transcriptional regulator
LGEQHEQLFSSIASRDSQAAAEVMQSHLLSVSNAMLRERTYGQAQTLSDLAEE